MKLLPVIFAICTALCWGMYGPTIGNAQNKGLWSPFKPYVFIGIAYVVLAIAGGSIAMYFKRDSFDYTGIYYPAAKWGFLAGLLGALGALFLTSAMLTSKGNHLLVMPIVFGGAVSVTALYSAWQLAGKVSISPALWAGIVMVVLGVVIVSRNTPNAHPASSHANDAGKGADKAAAPTEPAAIESSTDQHP